MKIGVVFENRVRPDSTGVYFAWALERMGHEVQHLWPDTALRIKEKECDFYLKVDDGIKQFDTWNDVLRPCAYYVIDTHYWDAAEWRPRVAAQFDHVFTAQKNGVDFLREHGVDVPLSWLPLAADENLHTPDVNGHDKYDWAFVGNMGHSDPGKPNKRLDYLDALLKRFPNGIISDYSYFKEMANLYGQARVVFNTCINNDINMRFWEGLCSGAVLITGQVDGNGMEELWDWPGAPLDECGIWPYQKESDLLYMTRCVLEGRADEYHNSRNIILEGHTYQHRCKEIISTMEGL